MGEGEQEMQLTPGDIITNVRPLTSKPGWSEGMLRGERAHFPDGLVELHVTELYDNEMHVFLSQPSEWLYCRSCHQLLVEAQEMSCCEGMFCLKCIEQWRGLGRGHCPGCTTTEGWHWHPNRAVERVLKGLHVLCRNRSKGCQWRGELRDQKEHLNKDIGCQFTVVLCPQKCGKAVMRMSLNDHVNTECQLRPFKCQYCQTMSTYTDIVNKHLPKCPMHPVMCPNHCGDRGVVRQSLMAHFTICPLQVVQCSNGCGVQALRRNLKSHLKDDCLKREIPCEYCKAIDTFEEIMGKHFDVCGHVPLDCPNKCSDEKILRQDLPDHIEKSCPLHMVGCEFAHVGCSERFCRRDRADHMAHSQAAHLSSVMTHLVLQEKKYDELQSSHELLKEKYQAHQKEYQGLLRELRSDFEALRLKFLRPRHRELEHAASLPPPPGGLPRVFCVKKCNDIRQWSTGKINVQNTVLIFSIHLQTSALLSNRKVIVSGEGSFMRNRRYTGPVAFRVSFELIHPEDESNNVAVFFDVTVKLTELSSNDTHAVTVSFSPKESTLIANTAHFKWERYMIDQSLYFRVTATK